MDAHYRSFARTVVPELQRQGIGILGMKKSLGGGIVLRSESVSAIECLHYALNLPTSSVITGIDSMDVLDQAFEAVRTFHPLSDTDVELLLAKTAPSGGRFELFKTTSLYDATAKNPHWLGEEPERLQNLRS